MKHEEPKIQLDGEEPRQAIRRRLAELAEENREWRRMEQMLMKVAGQHANALRAALWRVWYHKPMSPYRVRPWVRALARFVRAPFFKAR